MKLTKIQFWLFLILVLGLVIRIYNLGKESLWLDEVISIDTARLDLFRLVEHTLQTGTHTPLYYTILHYWIILFGDSDIAARALSVTFGFFALVMIYKVGSLLFNKRVGLLSCLLLSLSVFHIYHSQEARMYSLVSLLALLSFYFFIQLLRRANLRIVLAYILSSILLMYAHLYGLFVIAAQNIFIIISFFAVAGIWGKNSLSFRKWSVIPLILFILYIPWINVLKDNIFSLGGEYAASAVTVNSIIDKLFFKEFYNSDITLFYYILFISSLISVFSIISFKRGKRWIGVSIDNRITLLLLWLFSPIILGILISEFSGPVRFYQPMYLIGAYLAFIILTARGIDNIRNKFITVPIILVLVLLSAGSLRDYYSTIHNQQWREVATYVEEEAKSGDLVLINEGFYQQAFDHYSKRNDINKISFRDRILAMDEATLDELDRAIEGYARVWLVSSGGADPQNLLKTELTKSYSLLYAENYNKISLYLFVRGE